MSRNSTPVPSMVPLGVGASSAPPQPPAADLAAKKLVKIVANGKAKYMRCCWSWTNLVAHFSDISAGVAWDAHYQSAGDSCIILRNERDYEAYAAAGSPTIQLAFNGQASDNVLGPFSHTVIERFNRMVEASEEDPESLLLRVLAQARPRTLQKLPLDVVAYIVSFLTAPVMRRMRNVTTMYRHLINKTPRLRVVIEGHGLYVIGGINHNVTDATTGALAVGQTHTIRSVLRFDFRTNEWTDAASLITERYHCGIAVACKKIFVFGGRTSDVRLSTAEVYDPLVGCWKALPPMGTVRSAPACASIRGHVYIFGGYNGTGEVRTVDILDAETHQWIGEAPAMPLEACEFTATVLRGTICIVGGTQLRHSPEEKVLAVVQCYDPTTRNWTILPYMRQRRMCPAAVVVDNLLYVIGGSDGMVSLNSVDMYDADSNSWSPCPPMHTKRSNATATVAQGKIYVVGGFSVDNGGALSSAECYDPATKEWRMIKHMPEERDACKVVCLD